MNLQNIFNNPQSINEKDELDQVQRDHIEKYKIQGKPCLFRYEYDGIIVYDSKARIAGSDRTQQNQQFNQSARNYKNVYDNIENAPQRDQVQFLRMKQFQPFPQFEQEYTIEIPQDNSNLIFDSRFESGNLWKAIKIASNEYNLVMQSDTGTRNCAQWYYFSVMNNNVATIKFNIVNFYKSASSYQQGMKPVVWSQKQFDEKGLEWHRACQNISYQQNQWLKYVQDKQGQITEDGYLYTLSFTYQFEHRDDKVWFAYSFPYTVTKLNQFLDKITKRHKRIMRVNPICRTLAGNLCKMLTITNNIRTYVSNDDEQMAWRYDQSTQKRNKIQLGQAHVHKKAIVLTSRVHPGETVASYIIQGFIEFIISDAAKLLRDNFVFKIIPILNPDGVRYGNYRCSLIGADLNRRWLSPNEMLHPTIYYTKKMILCLKDYHEIALFCDIHGHSTKNSTFMYGNIIKAIDGIDQRKNLMIRSIPYLLSQKCQFFDYNLCRFSIEKSKEATARVVFFRQGINNSYTLEASFYQSHKHTLLDQFTTDEYSTIGQQLGQVFLQLISCNKFNRSLQTMKKLILPQKNQPRMRIRKSYDFKRYKQENQIFTDYEIQNLFEQANDSIQRSLIFSKNRIIHQKNNNQCSITTRASDLVVSNTDTLTSRPKEQLRITQRKSIAISKSPQLINTNIVNFEFKQNKQFTNVVRSKTFQLINTKIRRNTDNTDDRSNAVYSEQSIRQKIKSNIGIIKSIQQRNALQTCFQKRSSMRRFQQNDKRQKCEQSSIFSEINSAKGFTAELTILGQNPRFKKTSRLTKF